MVSGTVLPVKPILDLYLIPSKYGLLGFGFFAKTPIDPYLKRKSFLKKRHPLKEMYFVPWKSVTAWELIDIDTPRRLVFLANLIFYMKTSLSLLKPYKRLPVIASVPAWFTVVEDPLVFHSKVFDEILGCFRRFVPDKEVKGLEKNGCFVLVKKELERTEIIDVIHKKPEEIWGGKKKSIFTLKGVLKEEYVLSPSRVVNRYQLTAKSAIIDLLKVSKKLGFKGFDLYLTDRGIALLPDVPELDLPHDRVYWELDKNDPLVRKWAEILGVKPSLLTYNALLYKFIRAVNFRAASMFWSLYCEDDTTPSTLTATKKMIEKIKKGEIKELTYIGPDGMEEVYEVEDEECILVTLFWDPKAAPFKGIAYLDGIYKNEEGFECCSIKGINFGGGVMEFWFPHPLKKPDEINKFSFEEMVTRIYRLNLDEETLEILNRIYFGNEIPEQIVAEIHSEYERITREAPRTVKEIRKMRPKKYIPLLYYVY